MLKGTTAIFQAACGCESMKSAGNSSRPAGTPLIRGGSFRPRMGLIPPAVAINDATESV